MSDPGPQRGPASVGQIQAQTAMFMNELADIRSILHNLSIKLSKLDRIMLPTAEHWAIIHDAKHVLGLETPPNTTFSFQRKLVWEELRKQAREEICKHLKVGEFVKFRNKEHRVDSITPTFKVVLEYGGKKKVASPLGILPPEVSRNYSYMTGDTW